MLEEEEEFMTSEIPDLGGDGRERDIFSFSKYLRNSACAAETMRFRSLEPAGAACTRVSC